MTNEQAVTLVFIAFLSVITSATFFMIGRESANAIEKWVHNSWKGKSPSTKSKAKDEKWKLEMRVQRRRHQTKHDEARISRLNDSIAHFERCDQKVEETRPRLVKSA